MEEYQQVENQAANKKEMTRNQKKLEKYGDDVNNFSVADSSNITDGAVTERRCTDVFCLGFFLVFLVAMLSLTLYGYKKGDIQKYIAPIDKDWEICGYGERVGYPYLYFPNLVGDADTILETGLCVKKCPQSKGEAIECPSVYGANACGGSVSDNTYDTDEVMGYCMPDMDDLKDDRPAAYEAWKTAMNTLLTSNPAGQQLKDLYNASRAIYWSIAMSFVYCLLYIYLMSAFAEYIAWAMVAIVQLGLIGGSIFCIGEFFAIKSSDSTGLSADAKSSKETLFMALGIVFGLSALIFLICIYCGFNQLRIAINVIDASADFLAKTKRIIGVPILYFFLTVIVFITWIGSIMCINSMGNIEVRHSIPQSKHIDYPEGEYSKFVYMILFMFFGLLWICAFIRAKTSFITMVSATSYYFTSSKDQEGDADVGMAFKFAYMYHAGSLAFGSFLIALIQFIRIVFMVIAEQAQRASGENLAVKIVVACANCMLKCLEKICDYINKAAYAYMAVSGDSFCTSAWNGFLLNMKHCLKFSWANFLANGFIFIGKVGITVLNCFSCYFIMKFITKDLGELSSIAGPITVVALVTFISTNIFLGIFDEAVLALMTCLAIDTDLNGEPKFGPPTFHDSLQGFEREEPKNAIQDGGWEKPNTIN